MSPDAQETGTSSFTDEQLLDAYRQGSEAAAEALFQRYYARLVSLTRKQMGGMLCRVEDSADVALSVFRSIFIRGRGCQIELDAEDSLWPLLVTVALNKIRNRVKYWKRQRRDHRRQVPLQDRDPLETGATPEDAMQLQELIEQLCEPFSGRRRAVIDHLLQGLSVAEVARQTGVAQRTVYKTRAAARQILEQILANP